MTSSRSSLSIDLAGERWELTPEKAVWWARASTLLLADTHWGKSGAFRRVGVAVPDPSVDDLARLDLLCDRYHPTRLVFLGDFFHARSGVSEELLRSLGEWRSRRASMVVQMVRGNHDTGAGDPPPSLGIEVLPASWGLEGIAGTHLPAAVDGARLTLAGHLHPGISLSEPSGARLRAPCFWSSGSLLILPAFGSFTGLELVQATPPDRVFMVGPGMVREIRLPTASRVAKGSSSRKSIS